MIFTSKKPLLHKIEPDRQGARRHYGVHPYFTRRPYNVVRDYIAYYSMPGDKILDPFGGSGVTAIEAYLLGRTGIQNDINPLANFISDGLYFLSMLKPRDLQNAFVKVIDAVSDQISHINSESEDKVTTDWNKYINGYTLPPNVLLPKNSDVVTYHELFSKKQLLSLTIIKSEIDKIQDPVLHHAVLLSWSATLSKLNRTFLSAEGRKESRGGSSIFSIYRYKVADRNVELNTLEVFTNRVKNILKAQKELISEKEISLQRFGIEGNYLSTAINATELGTKFGGEIDYIFTDPPYGAHIAYLDLSTLWNIWLGKNPDKSVFENELIVGGENKHTEEYYIENLSKSIKTISQLVKDKCHYSIVFQHKNVKYFESILEAAFESNGELIASIPQGTGTVWSMHKKKGKHAVLAGEFILTFQKRNIGLATKKLSNISFEKLLLKYFDSLKIVSFITEEEVFNDLIILCWKENMINDLNYSALDIPKRLIELGYLYDEKNHKWRKTEVIIQSKMFS